MALRLQKRAGSPFWQITGTVAGVRVRESAGTADRAEADAIRARREVQIRNRDADPSSGYFFIEAVDLYLSGASIGATQTRALTKLVDYFADYTLKDMDQNALDTFALKHYAGCQPASVQRAVITPLTAVLTKAARRGWCSAPMFERMKEPPGRVRWITSEEAQRLIDNASGHLAPRILFMLRTGCRPGESVELDWRNVDLTARRVSFLDTKNGTSRGVPLHDDVVVALANLEGRTGQVFRRPDGEPYAPRYGEGGQFKTAFRAACRRAKIDDFTPHDCRHTFASWAVMGGVDLITVARLLGHKTLAMVQRYAHLSADHLRDSVDRIGTNLTHAPSEQPKKTGESNG